MKILKAIDKGYTILIKIITALLAAVMFGLVCTTTWQVLSRYFSGNPQMWPTDVATYALAFLTFIGMGVVLREDGHTRVDIVYMKLNSVGKHIIDIVMDIIGIATVITVTYYAFKLDASYLNKNTFIIGSVFHMPKYIVFGFVPVGMLITSIEYIRRLVKDIISFVKKEEK